MTEDPATTLLLALHQVRAMSNDTRQVALEHLLAHTRWSSALASQLISSCEDETMSCSASGLRRAPVSDELHDQIAGLRS